MSIKIGIIGAGGMANYHIPGFQSAGADVVAIADVNKAAAQNMADKFGIPTVYDDVAAMLKAEKLWKYVRSRPFIIGSFMWTVQRTASCPRCRGRRLG